MTPFKYASSEVFQRIAQLEAGGEVHQAQAAYEQVLAQNPQSAEAWHGLGLLLFNAGQLKQAAEKLSKAVILEPGIAIYQRNFAEMCRRLGLLDQAILSGKAAVKLAPKDLDAHANLGLAFSDAGDYLNAIQSFRKALKINAKHSLSWNNLGAALEKRGDENGALEAYQKAANIDPNNAEAQNNRGVIYVERGDLEKAIQSFEMAINAKPDFVECHYNLSSLKTYTPTDPHLRMLEVVHPQEQLFSTTARIRYNFALGKALEDVGEFDRSFAAYDMGNRLQHALLPVDEERSDRLAKSIQSVFTKEFFEERQSWSGTQKSPIFIVGMPRSGTTLLEQILSSHDSVYGAGELVDLSEAVQSVVKAEHGGLFAEKVVSLSAAQIKKIGDVYVNNVWKLSPESTFISDKMPANFLFIGLIHLAFPNAKIIHAMRDPMDSCFSCFARLFNDSMDMAYDLGTIGRYYVRYIKLMEHWHRVLPQGRILDLRYEDLVADTEAQTRRILDFVGLPWDANCLEFYKNKRVVKTASLAQVNKPIYKTSVARWRHFAKHLKPLVELVKDYRPADIDADFQYEENRQATPVLLDLPENNLLNQCLELQGKNLHLEVVQLLQDRLTPKLTSPQIWHVAGISNYRLNRFDEAKRCYESALNRLPDFPLALNSYGFLLQDLGLMEEARNAFARAVEIDPEFSMARFNLGSAQLKLGDFANGWKNYESRWQGSAEAASKNLQIPDCPLPKWAGQSGTENQSLLVITEQGFGDTFQFVRYLTLANLRFAKVGFVCSMPTLRLMEWSIGEDIALFNRMPTDYSDWDWQTPLLSLPNAFETRLDTIPADVPYLFVPKVMRNHWAERANRSAAGRLKIGIAWAGRNTHLQDARRSLAFEKLMPLFKRLDIAWFSLQKWLPGEVRPDIPAGVLWYDWADEFIDFADTAALAVNLDLVISIDSAPVHLAGALNVPVWMLNRYDGEWRWLVRRESSPWYPSLRIFNQTKFGDWDAVVQAVAAELDLLPTPINIGQAPLPSLQSPALLPVSESQLTAQQNLQPRSAHEAIEMANQLQSAGRSADAEQVLLKLLANEPNHAHAWHQLGVVLYQLGQIDRAIRAIEKAIAANPNDALFYSNIAEMCRQQGRLSESIDFGRRAIRINPMMALAHSNLGVALFDAGDLDGAEDSHRKALVLEPMLLQSLNTMGSIERAKKNKSAAMGWYHKALAVQPLFLESMSNLGAVLVESDRANEAASILEKAIELKPDYPAALCNLGLARIKQDRIEEALPLLQRSLQLLPGYLEAMVGLARAYFESELLCEALAILNEVIAKDARRAEAYSLMGMIYMEQGEATLAETMYQKVLEIDPMSTEARNGLGNIKMEAGDLAEAKELFLSSIEIDHANLDARFYLTQAANVTAEDGNTSVLEAMLASDQPLSVEKQVSLHYALGKSYDDLKQYERAFEQFAKGASLKRSKLQFDANVDNALTDRIIELVTREFFLKFQGAGDPSQTPIFILGMPRSGTTLIEQIVASHPEVFGAGELPDLFEVVQKPFGANATQAYPDNLSSIQNGQISTWGHEYSQRLKAKSPSSKKITDKMPANYMLMGLIPLMLPNAKIIHVMRDPVDTCFSCFTRLFNRHQNATYDLAELGNHYRNYQRLMEHWRKLLPAGSFMEVRYEDVVEDIDSQARRLIEYCDLTWDDRCLEFYKTKRSVRTASVAQVRKPIYRTSMARWRHYEKHLQPLLEALSR